MRKTCGFTTLAVFLEHLKLDGLFCSLGIPAFLPQNSHLAIIILSLLPLLRKTEAGRTELQQTPIRAGKLAQRANVGAGQT